MTAKFGSNNFGIDMSGTVEEIEPPEPAHQLDPVEYVKHIRKINPGNNGRPIDIRKARYCSRADLLATDPRPIELILQYGVSQPQLAKIYNVPFGSLGKIFKDLGVNTSVTMLVDEKFSPNGSHSWKKKVKPTKLSTDEREVITDHLKIAELMSEPDREPTDEFNWYSRQTNTNGVQVVTVRASGDIYFSTEFGKLFNIGDMVEIGLTTDCKKIAIRNEGTYRLGQCDKGNTSKQISASNIRDELQWKGILFPAKYRMERNSDIWSGVLMP